MAVLGLVGYHVRGSDLYAVHAQSSLRHALQHEWTAPAPPTAGPVLTAVALGNGVAILRVPRFGRNYAVVIVEGVGRADLRRGPGHYPGTALPGQVGNFAVAGHRTTYGAPFSRLGDLRVGDAVVLETRTAWLTYRVTTSRIVPPTAVSVTAPVPAAPGRRPSAALLTLTTCNPRYSDRERLVVFGALAQVAPKSAGLPPALAA